MLHAPQSVDAVVVAAEIVVALQVLVSRDISPFEPLVVTVGESMEAKPQHHGWLGLPYGHDSYVERQNAQSHARAPGTSYPAFGESVQREGETHVSRRQCRLVERFRMRRALPQVCREAVRRRGGKRLRRYPAGEDFSEYLDIVPGVFVFLGCRNPDVDAVYPQHSGYYTVDESVLKNGAALAAQYAIDFLTE